MQFLRLYETCRMICDSLLSNDVNFVEIGFKGYDVKPRIGAFQCEYLLHNPLFFLGKNFGDTRHPYEKNEPTLDHSEGGGVHGKACWLIA